MIATDCTTTSILTSFPFWRPLQIHCPRQYHAVGLCQRKSALRSNWRTGPCWTPPTQPPSSSFSGHEFVNIHPPLGQSREKYDNDKEKWHVENKVHTHTHNRFTALWILSGTTRVSRYQKKHSPTHTHHGHQSSLSAFSIYYNPWQPRYSIHVLCSLFPQSLSKFSMVCLLAWHPPLHTPYISSPNHYLLFATHAHTIATCFAAVPRLWHLILVSLSTLYLELYLVTSRHTSSYHSHLCPLKCHLIFLLTGQVSLPCNILFRTQLLYNLPLTVNDMSLLVSNGTNCLNFFHLIRILVSTAASASPSTLNMSPK